MLNRPDVWIVAASYSGALQLVLKTGEPEHMILAMSIVAETDNESGLLLLDKQTPGEHTR